MSGYVLVGLLVWVCSSFLIVKELDEMNHIDLDLGDVTMATVIGAVLGAFWPAGLPALIIVGGLYRKFVKDKDKEEVN